MGLIAVSVPLQGNFATQEQPVKRLSSKLPVGLSDLVADRGIPILSYGRPGQCGLQNVTMIEISELNRLIQVTLPPLAHLDTLWHLKWFFQGYQQLAAKLGWLHADHLYWCSVSGRCREYVASD